MSNTRQWRQKARTAKPNSRQKRNGLFLDAHPSCQVCNQQADEAHHTLHHGHPLRFEWKYMLALCQACHVKIHRPRPLPKAVNVSSQ
jgi:5-methylcytosine-specific restriction endonuclease McrA